MAPQKLLLPGGCGFAKRVISIGHFVDELPLLHDPNASYHCKDDGRRSFKLCALGDDDCVGSFAFFAAGGSTIWSLYGPSGAGAGQIMASSCAPQPWPCAWLCSSASKHPRLRFKPIHDYSRRRQARLLSSQYVQVLALVSIPYSHSAPVLEAGDVRNNTRTPGLYVRLALAGNKISQTSIARSPTPTWEHICSL